MRPASLRWKLILLYVGTVSLILAIFIGADVIGLKRNLLQQADGLALSEEMALAAWRRALWEHVLMGLALIGVVFMVGYAFIRKALKPVRDMARTARRITADDLSLRVDAGGDREELGELAQTMNAMIERLERSFSQIRRFSGDAAHELNTPLTVLRGEIEVALRKERPAEEYRRTLNELLNDIRHLSGIVDNLLFLTRADEKSMAGKFESVRLDQVALEAFEELAGLAGEKEIRYDIELLEELTVRGDADLLRRAVANLLQNAVKFSNPGGRVSLALKRNGDAFVLSVSDDGPGISKEHLPQLFQRFYRVDTSRSKRSGGAGLGLSIVEEIAGYHGFSVEVDSELGRGTEIRVTGSCHTAG